MVPARAIGRRLHDLCGAAGFVPGILLLVEFERPLRAGMETGKGQVRGLCPAQWRELADQRRPSFPNAWTKPPYHARIRAWVAEGAPRGEFVFVRIGPRVIALLPYRDVDLGSVDAADEIVGVTPPGACGTGLRCGSPPCGCRCRGRHPRPAAFWRPAPGLAHVPIRWNQINRRVGNALTRPCHLYNK